MLKYWYILMAGGGFAFGLFANRRPLGNGILVHPLALFFIAVAAGLLLLRFVSRKPVPQIISDRALAYGCCAGLGMFLVANFVAVHFLEMR
jgi:hypothetical protein